MDLTIAQKENDSVINSNLFLLSIIFMLMSSQQEEIVVLKVIDKIGNPEEKQKVLDEYIRIAKEIYQPRMQTNLQEKSQLYSLQEILKRIESQGSSKEPTISDLRGDILKTRVQVLEHINSQELSYERSKKEDDDQEFSKLLDKTQSTSLCRINKNSG